MKSKPFIIGTEGVKADYFIWRVMLNGDSGRLLSGAPGQKLGVVRPHCPPRKKICDGDQNCFENRLYFKWYGVRHLLLPLIYGEQFQTEMDADWKSVSSVKCRMRFDTSTHRNLIVSWRDTSLVWKFCMETKSSCSSQHLNPLLNVLQILNI